MVAMWNHEVVREGGVTIYQPRFVPTLKAGSGRVSLKWIADLKWAISRCDRRVRVVILIAREANADPRAVLACYPDDDLVMQITQFDATSGYFQACSVR